MSFDPYAPHSKEEQINVARIRYTRAVEELRQAQIALSALDQNFKPIVSSDIFDNYDSFSLDEERKIYDAEQRAEQLRQTAVTGAGHKKVTFVKDGKNMYALYTQTSAARSSLSTMIP